MKTAMTIFRTMRLAGKVTVVLAVLVLVMHATEASEVNLPRLPADTRETLDTRHVLDDSVLPKTAVPQWHPTWNTNGKWVMSKTIVDDNAVALNCKKNSYACSYPAHSAIGKGARCTIYMPEYEGYPDKKPPASWFWLWGREKAHCEFGHYHD